MSPLLAAVMALGDAALTGDLELMQLRAYEAGIAWARERNVPLTREHAVCIVGARATWAVVESIVGFALAGASDGEIVKAWEDAIDDVDATTVKAAVAP